MTRKTIDLIVITILFTAFTAVCVWSVAQTVELTAEKSGYYRVYVDDAEVSKHVAEREAIERATNEAIENPNSVVRYAHDYSVSVVVSGVDIEPTPEPQPDPEPTPDPQPEPEPAGDHSHFDALVDSPNCVASWSLREEPLPYNRDIAKELTKVDPTIDGMKMSLPPRINEMPGRTYMLRWNQPTWDAGEQLVVQYEFMISEAMRTLVTRPGINGRSTAGFKFVNLCRNDLITLEHRTNFIRDPGATVIDWRNYTGNRDGLTDRDEIAVDRPDPGYVGPRITSDIDWHPGPDSIFGYRDKPPLPHPQCFKARDGVWVRMTYELVVVDGGTRVRIWMADKDSGPSLCVSHPADSTKGFLIGLTEPISSVYLELDTSQGTDYAEDQPERWCGFRNVVVMRGVTGESVLGGRPVQ